MRVKSCQECGEVRPVKGRGLCTKCHSRWLRAQPGPVSRPKKPVAERFWAKVDKGPTAHSCWEWTGYRNGDGYGKFTVDWSVSQKPIGAYRVAYELEIGPVPEGMILDHICRNRACVRPDHLRPLSAAENVLIGIGPSALNARKTHCPRGHEYNDENTRWQGRKRHCRPCHVINQHAYLARKKAS